MCRVGLLSSSNAIVSDALNVRMMAERLMVNFVKEKREGFAPEYSHKKAGVLAPPTDPPWLFTLHRTTFRVNVCQGTTPRGITVIVRTPRPFFRPRIQSQITSIVVRNHQRLTTASILYEWFEDVDGGCRDG
jgi:hypothetical protein